MGGVEPNEKVPVIMDADLVLLIASWFLGMVFLGVAVPLIRKKVPPNRFYGLRTSATLADEAVWYEANARAGRDVFRLGLLVAVAGTGLYFVDVPVLLKVMAWLVVIEAGLMGVLIRAWRLADRLLEARQYRDENGE